MQRVADRAPVYVIDNRFVRSRCGTDAESALPRHFQVTQKAFGDMIADALCDPCNHGARTVRNPRFRASANDKNDMTLNRRGFMQVGALGLAVGSTLAACAERMSAAHASQGVSLAPVLDSTLLAIADAIGDALVPGVSAAGFASYLDAQLACPPEQSLLIARYLGVEPPYRDFYLPALHAVDSWARTRYGSTVLRLDADACERLVQDLADGTPEPWHAAPAPFVYFVLRSDAVDVAYGTRAGFACLGMPYMAHIEPERDW